MPVASPRTQAPDTALSPTVSAHATATDPPASAERLWSAAQAAGGPLVEPDPTSPEHRIVTFLWRDATGPAPTPAPEVLLVLDTITDRHRDALEPAILRPIGGGLRAVSYRLPHDLRASYAFHVAPTIAPDLGRTREGWKGVLGARVPDPLNPDRIPAPGDREVSILSLPGALPQPWRGARADATGEVTRHDVPAPTLGDPR
ncbi:MAG: DUF3327 domain-containing protein [Solirubrobacteraceae bacterium]|nr:DUF3327 domain-containing protein [Solirubrobacteraceae bacterium]